MSLFVLDEQLSNPKLLRVLSKRYSIKLLNDIRPKEHMLDDRIASILLTMDRPTFITIDVGLFHGIECHSRYGILHFVLEDKEQELLVPMLRQLLLMPEFATRAARMGKAARVTKSYVEHWELHHPESRRIPWSPFRKKR